MSETLASYSFLPWLRQGVANSITNQATDDTVILRSKIPINLIVLGKKGEVSNVNRVDKNIELYGPGDIVGIDLKAIVKTEPHNWITNFEPNYLPYIDFYDEDFPWRYTPAAPNGNRLTPWLSLVVLKEDEFDNGVGVKDKPLPFFKIKDANQITTIFPNKDQLWAWAHVHINTDLSNGALPNTPSQDTINAAIQTIIKDDRDKAYSRIISPRKLENNVGYHAFLIPTFESGRLAGLNLPFPTKPDPADNTKQIVSLPANECAWKNAANVDFPYYHRWYFRTGNVGDFEYLVDLLKPKPADKSVGQRNVDVVHIGSNLPDINAPEFLHKALKLGGALKVPFDSLGETDKQEIIKFDNWDKPPQSNYPHDFEKAIANRINLADDYAKKSSDVVSANAANGIVVENGGTDPDPVITSPLYGQWHALTKRLLKERDDRPVTNNQDWIHQLNLDPRFRVSAGLGTKVVQKGQEEYMQAAWEQVGKIVEANNKIRFAQLAKEVTYKLYTKHFQPLSFEKFLMLSTPVQNRIVLNDIERKTILTDNITKYEKITVRKQFQESKIPLAVISGTFRRLIAPRSSLMKQLVFDEKVKPDNILLRVNEGEVIISPPKKDPKGAINLSEASSDFKPTISTFFEILLSKYSWLKYLPLLVLVILAIIVLLYFINIIGLSVLGVAAIGLIALYRKINNWVKHFQATKAISEAINQQTQTPESIDNIPLTNFKISSPSDNFIPLPSAVDSPQAKNFKLAMKDAYTLLGVPFVEPERVKMDLKAMSDKVFQSINPALTIPKRTIDLLTIPDRIKGNMVETFVPIMAYPEIDIPMYKPLADMSSELFLPNINLIEQNSIALLENNQKFIEAYMVGINHEMSRELLWREYPTDQRGTYFRQFWDVKSYLPPIPIPENIKEELRDIKPIHTWHNAFSQKNLTNLGENNQRSNSQLVLVIRGELLKKYPTAVIYAHKATWKTNADGEPDASINREFVQLTDAQKDNPPKEIVKTPLFEAKVEPDIYFFGFDLDDIEAKGVEDPTTLADNAGWFFVIKERPGEPRFGLDIEKVEPKKNWNDLSWAEVGTDDGKCIEISDIASPNIVAENNDDTQATWNADTNAAELAYILYQVPVLVGVHASRMLHKNN